MSTILKGIDLPKKGEALSLFMMADGQVIITHIKDSRIWEYSEAEAIQIPKGHGDIKDAGNIIKKFDENIALAKAKPTVMYADAFLNDALEWSAEYIMIKDDIDNAPTILEAEE